MNTTIENDTSTTVASKARKTQRRVHVAVPAPTAEPTDLIKRPASELTRLVFMALLGCAACIALVGVVSQVGETGTSPDDPPPVVIVN